MNHGRSATRNETVESTLRLAVLIDADNAPAAMIEGLLAEIARFGEATVKRIYGDFTSPHSAQWKKVLHTHAIKPVQQFAYTTGKNATDSALIIDAMDLLYTRRFDGFCLVSSDSDFTGLALRIKEEGLTVFGFGEHKTPEAFRNACHKFIFTEVLLPVSSSAKGKPKNTLPKTQPVVAPAPERIRQKLPRDFMVEALEQAGDESGWSQLGVFGGYLTKLRPDFDPRLYGHKKLSDLVRSRPDIFVLEERQPPGSRAKDLYVRATDGVHAIRVDEDPDTDPTPF